VETANDLSEAKRALLERYLRQQLPTAAIGAAVQQAPAQTEASSAAHPRVPVVALQRGGSKRPFFYLHVHWQGGPLYCFTLARKLGADYPIYLLDPYRLDDLPAAPPIEAMATDYIQSLRSVQPEGPYLLGAFCGASVIAYEMAQQLRAMGQAVDLVFVEPMAGPIRMSRTTGWVARRLGALTRRGVDRQMDWFLRLRHLLKVVRHTTDEFTVGSERLMRQWCEEHGQRFHNLVPPPGALRLDWLAVFAWPVSGYVPRPYPGKLTYLLAQENPDNRSLWWGRVRATDNAEIHMVPGDNETCRTVHAEALTEELSRVIRRAQPDSAPSPAA
jgi:thioesterase superfamily protein